MCFCEIIATLFSQISMASLLTTHKIPELLLHPLHGFPEKQNLISSSKGQQQFGIGSKKSQRMLRRNGGCVKARSRAILELVPETKRENLEFELPMYDPSSKGLVLDLAVVGGGPAGLSIAQQVSQVGLSVCLIDTSPKLIWPNNYGVWVDEFEAMDLLDCLDTTWSRAAVFIDDQTHKYLNRPYGRVNRKLLKSKMMQKCISNGVQFYQSKVIKVIHEKSNSRLICSNGVTVHATIVLDATGFSRCLVQYDKPYNPGFQVAYGILAEVEEHPFDLDKMVLLDCRDSHLTNKKEMREKNSRIPTFLYAMPFSSDRIFLEETSIVARPGVPMEEIQERMVARLRGIGIKVKKIEEDERCVTPMGSTLPMLPQRVIGIGVTAGMVHPSTGYMLARTLEAAPVVADSIVQYLSSERRLSGDELSKEIWKDLWPIERRGQREIFCFGMEVLLKLDLQGTRRLFDAFFNLEPHYWHGYLSSRLFLPELICFGLSISSNASIASNIDHMTKGTVPFVNMIGNLIQDRD
ncbi:lycopene beta cyclase, chloroplastic/chromoplastic-like [Macadamia integrifolia]|uniref:lycopene beta cyclase, chloroplastic/chromoplastic-like n=1 Tax=Macadamia integrifolia TaxID=60698 RepID=UPI001C4EAB7B|nr:lycopene beta cyclase, chloroplastic/chromoplastic-like [Macadamia integrifolia]